MRRRSVVLILVLILAACSRDHGKPAWEDGAPETAAPAAASAAPAPAVASTRVPKGQTVSGKLSATGFGPYAIGATRAELDKAGLVGKVSTDKNGCKSAKGIGKWNTPGLVFTDGHLEHVTITSGRIRTTEGVAVGATYATVKAKYPAGKELADWVGAPGWFATSGQYALLFRLEDGKVSAIEAGTATALQFTFTDNQSC